MKKSVFSKVFKFNLFMVLIFSTSICFAEKIVLIKGTVQGEDKKIELILNLDDDNKDIETMMVDSVSTEEGYLTDTYSPEQVATGTVLFTAKGRDVVILQSSNFSTHNGGLITLNYLYNGATGSRGSEDINLFRDGDSWKVSHEGKEFTTFHFVKNRKFIIGDVGVKRIEFK